MKKEVHPEEGAGSIYTVLVPKINIYKYIFTSMSAAVCVNEEFCVLFVFCCFLWMCESYLNDI